MKKLSLKLIIYLSVVPVMLVIYSIFYQYKTNEVIKNNIDNLVLIKGYSEDLLQKTSELSHFSIMAATLRRSSFENDYYKVLKEIQSITNQLTKIGQDQKFKRSIENYNIYLEKQKNYDEKIFNNVRLEQFENARKIYESVDYEETVYLYKDALLKMEKELKRIELSVNSNIVEEIKKSLIKLILVLVICVILVFITFRAILMTSLKNENFNKILEEQILIRTSELNEAQEIAKIGSWKFDVSQKVFKFSNEQYRIFEIDETTPAIDLEKKLKDRIHPDDLFKYETALTASIDMEIDFDIEIRLFFSSNKKIKTVRIIGKVNKSITDENKLLFYITGTCQDLTETIKIKEQLENERSKSIHNAKLASLGEVSAGMAHEINNPLTIISMALPLLTHYRNQNDSEKFNSKIDTISNALLRIEKIIKGLKKFSRVTEGTMLKKEKLSNMISEVMVFVENKIKSCRVDLSIDVDDSLSVNCDQLEIEQVFINLLNNSIDAIKKHEKPWIKISAFSEGNNVVVRFIDSGNGIPIDIEEKLFQPFFTTKPIGEGTGLGLSISKGILDTHNAEFYINRNFPNTCFEIKFRPLLQIHPENLKAS